jgi:hypothetical protein
MAVKKAKATAQALAQSRSSFDRRQWDKMLAAYRDRPTVKHVMAAGDVGRRIARRAIMEGWPDLNLPAFVELAADGTSVHKEMAKLRETWEESAVTQGEAARMAAEQAMAARVTMGSAMKAMRLSQCMADKMLEKIERGELAMPEELTPQVVRQVVASMDSAASIVKKAIEIEQARAGEPEANLGMQIGIMIERCSETELEDIIRTGHMPDRLLDQRRMVSSHLSDTSSAEAIALGEDTNAEVERRPMVHPDSNLNAGPLFADGYDGFDAVNTDDADTVYYDDDEEDDDDPDDDDDDNDNDADDDVDGDDDDADDENDDRDDENDDRDDDDDDDDDDLDGPDNTADDELILPAAKSVTRRVALQQGALVLASVTKAKATAAKVATRQGSTRQVAARQDVSRSRLEPWDKGYDPEDDEFDDNVIGIEDSTESLSETLDEIQRLTATSELTTKTRRRPAAKEPVHASKKAAKTPRAAHPARQPASHPARRPRSAQAKAQARTAPAASQSAKEAQTHKVAKGLPNPAAF